MFLLKTNVHFTNIYKQLWKDRIHVIKYDSTVNIYQDVYEYFTSRHVFTAQQGGT